ncbi:hypothetical protein ACIA8I_38705 [Streptomyces rishiriensis]|uniref:hypothetical protein n=1 Tax=Streptomyces rishiriensis TaxID=68264 RepID=UPI0037A95A3A
MPIRGGLITAQHVHAELGELALGRKTGRGSPKQINLCKSVGVVVQNAAAAALVITAAVEQQHTGWLSMFAIRLPLLRDQVRRRRRASATVGTRAAVDAPVRPATHRFRGATALTAPAVGRCSPGS